MSSNTELSISVVIDPPTRMVATTYGGTPFLIQKISQRIDFSSGNWSYGRISGTGQQIKKDGSLGLNSYLTTYGHLFDAETMRQLSQAARSALAAATKVGIA